MPLDLRLVLPPHIPPDESERAEYDDALDSVASVFHDICDSLGKVEGIEFHAVFCGVSLEPTIEVELCIAIEAVVDVLVSLRDSGCASLDFYEQGGESRVDIRYTDDLRVGLRLEGLAVASVGHLEDTVSRVDLQAAFRDLAWSFVTASRLRCPLRSRHPLFASWLERLQAVS